MGSTISSYFRPVNGITEVAKPSSAPLPYPDESAFSEIGNCCLCREENILITFSCGHQSCMDCFHSLKFYVDECFCVVCNKSCRITKVSVFSV